MPISNLDTVPVILGTVVAQYYNSCVGFLSITVFNNGDAQIQT